ncbi:hypothetical protein ETB99_13420 [Anoxybacillus sp. CHMUD]|nr:hypothetical protein [Anoxybacillus sp. CHMUD]
MTTAQRCRSCLHRYRFSQFVCWQYLVSTHNRRTYARCFTVTTFPVTNSIHRVAVIGVPLFNGFLHAFIISYTKERGNAHSSPTYSLWSLKWESPARNRMKKLAWVVLLIMFTVYGCTSQGNTQQQEKEQLAQLEVVFQTTPQTIYVDEPATLQVTVTDGKKPIEQASDVQFEIRRKGEEHDEMIPARHQGNGVYVAEKTFGADGVYVVTYHVTANHLHRMEKNEVRVEQKQGATTKTPTQSNDAHTHHHVHMTLSPKEAKQNERTMFQVQMLSDGKPLTDAQVTMEYWRGGDKKHTYVTMNEKGNGMYVSEVLFAFSGTYQFRVHVIKEELHDHQVFSVEVK